MDVMMHAIYSTVSYANFYFIYIFVSHTYRNNKRVSEVGKIVTYQGCKIIVDDVS